MLRRRGVRGVILQQLPLAVPNMVPRASLFWFRIFSMKEATPVDGRLFVRFPRYFVELCSAHILISVVRCSFVLPERKFSFAGTGTEVPPAFGAVHIALGLAGAVR